MTTWAYYSLDPPRSVGVLRKPVYRRLLQAANVPYRLLSHERTYSVTIRVNRPLVKRLVADLRECEQAGWTARMDTYGFGFDHAGNFLFYSDFGECCCFLGAAAIRNRVERPRHSRILTRSCESSHIAELLDVTLDFIQGFNEAVVRINEIPTVGPPEYLRGHAHGQSAYQLWQKSRPKED